MNVELEQETSAELKNETKQMGKISKSLRLSKNIAFKDFTRVEICGPYTNNEIISKSISLPSDDDEASEPSPSNTVSHTKYAIHILRWFIKYSEKIKIDDFTAVFRIEKLIK